jgi:c-di-GMP-binding flagellar brake protein YcgR
MAAILSLPSAGMLRHQKSRFLAIAENGFWMECTPDDHALIDELIRMKTPAGVSYKSSTIKSVFMAVVLERVEKYQINAETAVHAVRMQTPDSIKQVQRRQNYRVRVTADSEIRLDVWRMAPRVPLRDRPSATAKLNADLLDLSLGGIGVIFTGEEGQPPRVCEEDRLRIQISTNETELLIEGSMRFPQQLPDKSKIKTGIQFKKLENDIEGRQNLAKLTKIVGELQRQEARRNRLGVA